MKNFGFRIRPPPAPPKEGNNLHFFEKIFRRAPPPPEGAGGGHKRFKYVKFHIYIIDNQIFNIISKNNHTKVLTNTKKTTNFAVSNQLKIRKLEVKNKQYKIKL